MEIRPGEHLKVDIIEVGKYTISFTTAGTEAIIIFEGQLVNKQSTSLKGEYTFIINCQQIPNYVLFRNMGRHKIINLTIGKEQNE